MPGNIGKIEGNAPLIDPEIVHKVTGQIQRRNDLMSEIELVNRPRADWQHVHLHLTTRILIFL